ncbi:MAG: hypothetical protein QOG20_966 [Pseudonocardiales bacterium]|nr:hypothetical protein [Pseudonocardiales bacterium]
MARRHGALAEGRGQQGGVAVRARARTEDGDLHAVSSRTTSSTVLGQMVGITDVETSLILKIEKFSYEWQND